MSYTVVAVHRRNQYGTHLVLLLIFGHIQTDEALLRVFVQILRYLFRQFGLADAARAQEQKHQWPIFVVPPIFLPPYSCQITQILPNHLKPVLILNRTTLLIF